MLEPNRSCVHVTLRMTAGQQTNQCYFVRKQPSCGAEHAEGKPHPAHNVVCLQLIARRIDIWQQLYRILPSY